MNSFFCKHVCALLVRLHRAFNAHLGWWCLVALFCLISLALFLITSGFPIVWWSFVHLVVVIFRFLQVPSPMMISSSQSCQHSIQTLCACTIITLFLSLYAHHAFNPNSVRLCCAAVLCLVQLTCLLDSDHCVRAMSSFYHCCPANSNINGPETSWVQTKIVLYMIWCITVQLNECFLVT